MPKKNSFSTHWERIQPIICSTYQSPFDVKSLTLKLPYVVHCLLGPWSIDTVKKRLSFFPSPAGMSQTKLSLARNNLIIVGLFYSIKKPQVWMRLWRGCCCSAVAAGLLNATMILFIYSWSWEDGLEKILEFVVELYSDPSRSLITYLEAARVSEDIAVLLDLTCAAIRDCRAAGRGCMDHGCWLIAEAVRMLADYALRNDDNVT
jgi:hypothetical protein